jgi:hypothetical protein
MERGLNITLISFSLLLASLIGFEIVLWDPVITGRLHETASFSPTAGNLPEIEKIPELRLPGLRLYREITERPLFAKARRPAFTDESQGRMWDFPEELMLQGIFGTAEKRTAVFFDKQTTKKFYLSTNQQLSGWRIVMIMPTGVILVKGHHQKILRLEYTKVQDANP